MTAEIVSFREYREAAQDNDMTRVVFTFANPPCEPVQVNVLLRKIKAAARDGRVRIQCFPDDPKSVITVSLPITKGAFVSMSAYGGDVIIKSRILSVSYHRKTTTTKGKISP